MRLHLLRSMWHKALQPVCMGEGDGGMKTFSLTMTDNDTPHLKLALSTGSKLGKGATSSIL